MRGRDGVYLGGETVSRGLLRTRRTEGGDRAALVAVGVLAVVVLGIGGGSVVSVVATFVIVVAGLMMCIPWPMVALLTEGTSVRTWLAARASWWVRDRLGLTAFTPGEGVQVPSSVGSVTTTDELVDDVVVGVTEPSRSMEKGRSMVTVVEVQGDPMRRAAVGARWTSLLEFLGSEASAVSHVSVVASVTDWDATDHVWLTQQDLARITNPSQLLISSYGEVVDRVLDAATARRTWLVLRFPVNRRLQDEGSDDGSMRQAVADQTVAVVDRARMLGLRMRPLSGRGHAALCRHLMDPEVSADDFRDLGAGRHCWVGAVPEFTTSADRRALVVEGVNGRRWMSTWETPGWTVEPGMIPTDFLYPVVTALTGQLNRSFVVTCELVESHKARKKAREDLTSDAGALGKEETVTDGTNEVQALGSQIRLEDLGPGRSTVGVNWSMAVTFHSSSAAEHVANERRMIGALADSQITSPVRWRWRQDRVVGLVLPFARAWRTAWIERVLS